jgi:predicted amidohydrolase
MDRKFDLAVAQVGGIQPSEGRATAVQRLIRLLEQSHHKGASFVVFPELTLTTFFPRYWADDLTVMDRYFETEMPSVEVKPLFDRAAELRIGFYLGYAELTPDGQHFNTAILVDSTGYIVGKYRKIHLPGHAEHEPSRPFQHLEKRYFDVGNLGFGVWRLLGGLVGMCICNDRRWPETYRVMGLQGVEMILLGYNTPVHNPPAPEHDLHANFHNQLVMQAGAYQNATWVVGVAKAGREEGVDQIGQSQIIAPSGQTVAMASTLGDELVVARCDLDLGRSYRTTVFDFARHRRPEHYRLIVERTGAAPPV